jgi:uncharacterized protein YabN with tetrapyrrole methylase and pyrophosphatase domain
MANIYKNVQKLLNAAGSDVDMYESPTATASIIKTVKLFNTHSGALDVTIKVFDASSSTDFEYKVASISANEGVDLLTFNNIIVLEAGDKLKMQCATADKIKMTASLLQKRVKNTTPMQKQRQILMTQQQTRKENT